MSDQRRTNTQRITDLEHALTRTETDLAQELVLLKDRLAKQHQDLDAAMTAIQNNRADLDLLANQIVKLGNALAPKRSFWDWLFNR